MEHPIKTRLHRHLPMLVLILCILQPCMDVLSFWMDKLQLPNTLTLMLRMLMLLAVMGLGFLLSRRKRYYWGLAAILAAYTLAHMVVCFHNGYQDPVTDLTNLVRIFQLPMLTLAFITFLRENSACQNAIRRGFFLCLMMVLAVEVLSVATGTEPYTYDNKAIDNMTWLFFGKNIGIRGWFYLPSAQSAILTMLVPVALCACIEKKRFSALWTAVASLVCMGLLYFFGTRLTFAALLGIGLGLSLCLLLVRKLSHQHTVSAALAVLLCTSLAAAGVMQSPMRKNDVAVSANATLKQTFADALVQADAERMQQQDLNTETVQTERLRATYEAFLPGLVHRFGLERTAALYHGSTKSAVLSDLRLAKKNYCRLLQQEKPGSKIFGLELADMSYERKTYDVENDFHGIYYLCGAAGLLLMLAFFAFFFFRILRALVRDFRRYFTVEAIGCGLALGCGIAHAYFTAGVLRRPNATVYLAMLLAMAYQLTRKDLPRKSEEE